MRIACTLFFSVLLFENVLAQEAGFLRTTHSAGGVNQVLLTKSPFFIAQSIGQEGVIGTFSRNGRTLIQGYIQPTNRLRRPDARRDLRLEVYPNPFSKQFTIRLDESINSQAELLLLDMVGRKIYGAQTAVSNEIVVNLDTIDQGIYILFVKVGEKSTYRKIIKRTE